MREDIYARMYEVEDRHWWFAAKRRIIRDMLRRYVEPPASGRPRLADVGCGCGRYLEEAGRDFAAVGVDASEVAIDFCRRRGVDARRGSIPESIGLDDGAFDAVVMADVVEHIDDDAAAVRAACTLLKPRGVMVVTVPALPGLWTSWDDLHGHKRRYTKAAFARLFAIPGCRVELLSYYNTLLFPAAALSRTARRLFGKSAEGELKVPPAPANRALEAVFAAERMLIGRVPMPVGLSLIAVTRRV
jgi:SAM-dependent methyltransferase